MGLFERINEDLKTAMKEGARDRVGVFRMLLSEIKRVAIDQGTRDEIDDDLVLATLTKGLKSRQESVRMYREGDREDLAAKEESEIEVIRAYLPEPLTEDELAAMVDEAVTAAGAESMKDMGKVMKEIMPRVTGRADGKDVKRLVMARLQG